jgi:hypothetical protein
MPIELMMRTYYNLFKVLICLDVSRGQCGGANAETWCVFASTLIGMKQEMGKRVPLGPNDGLRMKCRLFLGRTISLQSAMLT